MAKSVSTKIIANSSIKSKIGRKLLETITAGMYSDPLMIIREYIQNAVDSIDFAINEKLISRGQECINIDLIGKDRKIIIEDNGFGISYNNVENILCAIGKSNKSNSRGFRGIGRLGGIAYCKRLIFVTRALGENIVSEIEYDGSKLRYIIDGDNKDLDLGSAFIELTKFKYRNATEHDQSHFFKVIMENVNNYYGDVLLNIIEMKRYLSCIAPVPYKLPEFNFADKLNSHFHNMDGWWNYNIFLNGTKIYKPYSNIVNVSQSTKCEILNIELFDITNENGILIGKGWYAITDFLGAISNNELMRGIRVRQGNIGIGNEYFLENIYSEHRFALWHVGEIELNYNMKLNARRDDFEHSREYERFLAFMIVQGRKLSSICRRASSNRSKEFRMINILNKADKLIKSNSIFFDKSHAEYVINKAEKLIELVKPAAINGFKKSIIGKRYRKLERITKELKQYPRLLNDCIDEKLISRKSIKDILVEIYDILIKTKNEDNLFILPNIIKPYLKKNFANKLMIRRNIKKRR